MGIRKNKITTKGKNTDSLVGSFFQRWKNLSKKRKKYVIIGLIYVLIIFPGWFFLSWGYRFSLIAELIANLVIPLPFVALALFLIWLNFHLWRIGWPKSTMSLFKSLSLPLVSLIVMLAFFSFVFGKTIVNDIKDCFGGTVTREISVTAFTARHIRGSYASHYMEGFLEDGTPIRIGISFCFGGSLAVPGRSAKTKFIETMPHNDSDTVKGKITYYPHSLKFIKFEKL